MVEREPNRCIQAWLPAVARKHGLRQNECAMGKDYTMITHVEPPPNQALQRTRGTRTAEP